MWLICTIPVVCLLTFILLLIHLCKGAGMNTSKNERANPMTISVCLLVTAMVVLVIIVIGTILREHDKRYQIIVSYSELIDNVKVIVNDPSDTLRINNESIDKLNDISTNLLNSIESLNDSNNGFNSIMLAMITLCATLAVVIPYVVGKSLTHQEVMDMVKKEAEDNRTSFDKKNAETVKALEWSEAHNCRMIAYLLLQNKSLCHNPTDTTKGKNEECDSQNDKQIKIPEYKPEWVIGWASKALIRYFKQERARPDTQKFCNYCLTYISEASKDIKTNVNIDILIRSIKDAYDVLGFHRISTAGIKIELNYEKAFRTAIVNMLNQAIKIKCKSMVKHKFIENKPNYQVAKEYILDEIAARSKYKEYNKDNDSITKFQEDLSQFMDAEIKCDNLSCTNEHCMYKMK